MEITTVKTTDEQVWAFFCKELGKAKVLISCYRTIIDKMDVNDDAYNQFFQLILDSMTSKIALIISYCFDTQNDAWRITRIVTNLTAQSEVKDLETKAEPILEFRHKRTAHLGKDVAHNGHFKIFTSRLLDEAEQIIDELVAILNKHGAGKYGYAIVPDWVGIKSQAEVMFEHLEEGTYLLDHMGGFERQELREKIAGDQL